MDPAYVDIAGHAYRKSAWRDASLDARITYISKKIYIPHRALVAVVKEIERRARRCALTGVGDGMHIIAETGCTKSFLARLIVESFPPVEHSEMTERPAVTTSMPPKPSAATLAEALLEALGDLDPDKGDTYDRVKRVKRLLIGCKVRIVLLDNVHRIPEKRGYAGIRDVADTICDWYDAVPAVFVLLGIKGSMRLRQVNTQGRRRALSGHNVPYFGLSTPEETARWMRFLQLVDDRLPLAEACGLAQRDMSLRLFCASNGITDTLLNLLREAIELAVKGQLEKITLEMLQQAFVLTVGNIATGPNPFDKDFEYRRLDQPGEVFHAWLEDIQPRKDAA